MKFIGIFLYVFWLLLLLFRYANIPKKTSFSYKRLFFGSLSWYRNIRNLTLLIALFIVELFLPLKSLYLLFLITGIVIIAICINNLRVRIGRPLPTMSVLLLGLVVSGISGIFVFSL
ncbi:hypothetical protein [Liquorilactobacillus sucicola]|uniref:hypothetical protein n=1 Tax=Liquorilactobacillus sucicola TaxID=519050 RepID=UPI0005576578|nr:hypothetical protein [Liquorilactobacillus sucicola]